MGELKLDERYERHAVIDLFGPESPARILCDGQWVIFPGAVLGFAAVGEPPRASHFRNAGEFCWVADKPYRVRDDKHVLFVPPEIIAGHAGERAIHWFVRGRGEEPYRYVGELGRSHTQSHWTKQGYGAAFFALSPALPSQVWIELGGLRPGDLDHAAVDAALDRLHQPISVAERLGVLRRLVEYWHGLIRPEDGIPDADLAGLDLPDPLRWWYRWAGRRTRVMSGQNFLRDPGNLRIKDGLLEFYVENQYCYQWGTLSEGEDPPVFGRENPSDPWVPEGMTLSEHLILACLFEAIICHSPYGASKAWLTEDTLDRIVEHLAPIAINAWRWAGSTRFYAKGGAFLSAMGEFEIHGGYSVWIGAKTEHPLQFLKPFLNREWEYIAV
jgi:hypothetical protein